MKNHTDLVPPEERCLIPSPAYGACREIDMGNWDGGSKRMVTAPVSGESVDGQAGIPSLLPYGRVLSRKNRNSK